MDACHTTRRHSSHRNISRPNRKQHTTKNTIKQDIEKVSYNTINSLIDEQEDSQTVQLKSGNKGLGGTFREARTNRYNFPEQKGALQRIVIAKEANKETFQIVFYAGTMAEEIYQAQPQ